MTATLAQSSVEVLKIDRPQRRNALDRALTVELIERLPLDPPPERRCYLIHGAGSVFCAGADVASVEDGDSAVLELLDRVVDQPLPVVCWLNGPAFGAGTFLALACDIRLAAPETYLRMPAAKLGIGIPADRVDQLARRLGDPLATRLLLAALDVDRESMLAAGLVEPAATLEEALSFCEQLARLAPLTLGNVRRGLQGRSEKAEQLYRQAMASSDLREGIAAFRERRLPRFEGR